MINKLYIQSKNIYRDKITYTLSDYKEYTLKQVVSLFKKNKIEKASLVQKTDGSYYIRGHAGYPIVNVNKTKENKTQVYNNNFGEKVFERDLYDDLLKWKNGINNYVLKLSGPRQVGKTYLLKKFANENFDKVVYINLGKDTNNTRFMDTYNSVSKQMSYINSDELINVFWNRVFKLYDKNFVDSSNCIVIIDEIQEQPIIFNNIRNFHRNLKARVAVTGSYIGLEVFKKDFWEAAGDYEELTLNSLSYTEFLKAFGVYDDYMKIQNFEYLKLTSEEKEMYKKIEFYYNLYLQIGGYPDVIHAYMKSNDISSCDIVLKNLVNSYINESNRYFDDVINEEILLNTLIDTCKSIVDGSEKLSYEDKIPLSLKYNMNSLNVSLSDKKSCLKWLYVTHIINNCMRYNNIYDLSSYAPPQFYFNDLGILRYIYSNSEYFQSSHLNGMLAENFVYLYLKEKANITRDKISIDRNVYKYYQKNSPIGSLEIDFLLKKELKKLISLEVKHSKGKTASSDYLLNKHLIYAVIQLSNTFGNLSGKMDSNGNLVRSYKFPIFMILRLEEFLKTL